MRIIAAIRNGADLKYALESNTKTIFFLSPNILELKEAAAAAHASKKKIFIHIDLTEGVGKDNYGIKFVKKCGVDGIISTRANLIKIAREIGMITVQRFFIVDSRSVDTTVETLKSSKADMIEVMPGIAGKIIDRLKERVLVPIIAGGLIDTPEEAYMAKEHGVYGVSTSNMKLWNL